MQRRGVDRPSAVRTRGIVRRAFSEFSDAAAPFKLAYTGRLVRDDPRNAMIIARATHEGAAVRDVMVKFAHRYSKEAHELLSNAPPLLAPALLRCACVSNVDHLFVVAMDYVASGGRACDRAMRPAQPRLLRSAVAKLHAEGLVFGDLRGPNVLLVGENELTLVDFDWAGKAREARYPDFNVLW